MPATQVYLDTNALSYFYMTRDGWSVSRQQRARLALRREKLKGRLRFTGSLPTLEELMGIAHASSAEYQSRRRLFWSLIDWRLALTPQRMLDAEIVARGPVQGNARFFDRPLVKRATALSKSNGAAREISGLLDAQTQAFQADMETRRQTIRAKLADWGTAKNFDKWWKNADALIADWSQGFLRSSQQRLNLSDADVASLDVRTLPTLWNFHAYHMARIVLNVGRGEKISKGDSHDARHFSSACYSNVLVSDDGALSRTFKLVPNPPFELLTFNAFANRFLNV